MPMIALRAFGLSVEVKLCFSEVMLVIACMGP